MIMDRDLYFELYGVSSWLYAKRSLERALTKIAGAGFRQVELWAEGSHLDPRAAPDIQAVSDVLRDLGLRVHSVHLPFAGMGKGPAGLSATDYWLELSRTTLEYCAQLGGQIAVVHVRGPAHEASPEDDARGAINMVAELKQTADRLEVRLALENMLRLGRRKFDLSLAELARVFPDESIGFCLDTGHAAVNGVDVTSELHSAGPRLLSVHANNNDGREDIHASPVQGVLDWTAVEDGFKAIGYEGCRVLEVSGWNKDPDVVLRELQELWKHF
jgi:sugar phosphate isomerase/epimerase